MSLPSHEPELFNELGEAVVAVDDHGRIMYASPDALRLLGRDQTLLGKPLATIIPPRLRARHHAGFQNYVTTGTSKLQGNTVRVPALRGDGTESEVDLTIRVFRRPDGSKLVAAALSAVPLGRAPPGLQRLEAELIRRLYALV